MNSLYPLTLVAESPWKRLSPAVRQGFIRACFLLTWAALVLGVGDVFFWKVAIGITAAQVIVMLALVRFRPMVFPVQLRILYTGWLALGTFVPELAFMMYASIVGLATNLAFGYCPLARMVSLLPWNREAPLSLHLLVQTFIQPPGPGRFAVQPRASLLVVDLHAPVSDVD
jgi:hypothetical protein